MLGLQAKADGLRAAGGVFREELLRLYSGRSRTESPLGSGADGPAELVSRAVTEERLSPLSLWPPGHTGLPHSASPGCRAGCVRGSEGGVALRAPGRREGRPAGETCGMKRGQGPGQTPATQCGRSDPCGWEVGPAVSREAAFLSGVLDLCPWASPFFSFLTT